MIMVKPLVKLSDTERATVEEIIRRTAGSIYFDHSDLSVLFAAWEKMFPGSGQKQTCRACVTYVVSNLRRYVEVG